MHGTAFTPPCMHTSLARWRTRWQITLFTVLIYRRSWSDNAEDSHSHSNRTATLTPPRALLPDPYLPVNYCELPGCVLPPQVVSSSHYPHTASNPSFPPSRPVIRYGCCMLLNQSTSSHNGSHDLIATLEPSTPFAAISIANGVRRRVYSQDVGFLNY